MDNHGPLCIPLAVPSIGVREKFAIRTVAMSFDTQTSVELPSKIVLVNGASILRVTTVRN